MGNPALTRSARGDGAAFRRAHGLTGTDPVLLVLPGSRRSEIASVAPVLMAAARRIKAQRPDVHILVQPAASIEAAFRERFGDIDAWARMSLNPAERYDAMAAADMALACSGTVTSEVAMQGAALIVGYRTGWITWALARGLLYRKTHITLMNILNGDQEIVPEFVQTRLDPDLISRKALAWLCDPEALAAQRRRQAEALKALVRPGKPAAEIAAEAILDETGPA
jgi:lipid-A-disaccharide synthase